MTRAAEVAEWITKNLPDLVAEHGVPGAQIAVLVDGEVVDTAAGVVSKATGVPVTTDAVFQIGSITKVWTATLVQQLVNEGLLDLDRPVRDYLPEFVVADEAASATITTRQLLCHVAGVEGDLFTDTGANEDAVQRYVGTLADAAQLFPPGERFSYCNSGYVVLGRLVEVLRGKPFNTALREQLITPLGLEHVATHIGEAILELPAIGHVGKDVLPAPVYSLTPSNAPAGAVLSMRARSLLGFVRMHLSDSAFDGMREPQVDLPPLDLMGGHWGLGWMLFDYPGGTVIGHDGGTLGQSAFLRVVPEAGVAVALLTNGGDVLALYRKVFGHLLGELAGVRLPELAQVPAEPEPIDAHRTAGTYRSTMLDLELEVRENGSAWLTMIPRTPEAKVLLGEVEPVELVRLDENRLISTKQEMGRHSVYVLVGEDSQGRARYLHNGRAVARAAE
ncbi:serine hydrolase domain-containing protein [Kutzneria viridogrisea]|uniref:CubicO group peptidase (Beta-lactamase class C family) n=1 Tax=Kutzneria viridogrisea TaxID=47990 RepID=A0ABR6BJ95_9PSEU|nr:CubicO group peptidase (beta-lactamase class C family) [Kutzneria viridogrisea]